MTEQRAAARDLPAETERVGFGSSEEAEVGMRRGGVGGGLCMHEAN